MSDAINDAEISVERIQLPGYPTIVVLAVHGPHRFRLLFKVDHELEIRFFKIHYADGSSDSLVVVCNTEPCPRSD